MSLTHWKQLQNPNYIGAYSLQPGELRTVEIVSVSKEMVTGADGKKEECTVAKLKGEKPFILNATNCKSLQRLFGSPYIEEWKGKKCIIYAEKVKAFGDVVEALRIKSTAPILPELVPSNPKWADAVKALRDGKGIDVIESRYTLSDENRELLISEAKQNQK